MLCDIPTLLAHLVLVLCPPEFQVEMTEYETPTYGATSSYMDNALRSVLEASEADVDDEPEEVAHYEDVFIDIGISEDRTVWDDLADCESGNWIDGGFEEGSARWHVGGTDDRAQPRPSWSNGLFYGGLQFHPPTWEWVAPMVLDEWNSNPANHSREEQIKVAEKTKELQGWGAWPTCTRKMGLR